MKKYIIDRIELWIRKRWIKLIEKERNKTYKLELKLRIQKQVVNHLFEVYNEHYNNENNK